MECLCDEVLQLVFYELADPSPLTLVSRRFYRFSQDPYVRARYFLTHYGHVEAMFYALGRGKILNERVLDILLSTGAQLSRYLIQIAMHHYFHTQSHFIKTHWVRSVPLRVFTYLLKVAEEKYGDIPRGKGEDDGSIFTVFLKESRVPSPMKAHTWETIKALLETYKFIPFSHKDPLMAHFPLALAIEPRLLPSAIANGFSMDYKYRNFVFRKMFERPSLPGDIHTNDIVNNVRELCKLDPAMFVSRTVAAEVCMEAKSNEVGYNALKELDKSSDLRFELSTLVEDLLRTFLTTRSICSISTGDVLLHLFSDYPSIDASVRLVVLIVVFISADDLHMSLPTLRAKLETLGLMPITRRDVFNILVNPFVESFDSLLEFAAEEIGVKEDGSKGMSRLESMDLVSEVVAKCVEISCKGKLVKRLCEAFPSAKITINRIILSEHQIELESLPSWDDDPDHATYRAALSRDYITSGAGDVHTPESLMPERKTEVMIVDSDPDLALASDEIPTATRSLDAMSDNLGDITQENLTAMIRHDESVPVRSRRRNIYVYSPLDLSGKMRYPHDALPVAKWVKTQYGPRSPLVAVFMTHAVVNGNGGILHYYLDMGLGINASTSAVPVTLKHFHLLARLGRSPSYYMWASIELGAEFYFDEDDYLSDAAKAMRQAAMTSGVKVEPSGPTPGPSFSGKGKKRPRRSAAVAVLSYAVPGSDDENLNGERSTKIVYDTKKKVRQETKLQLWIKHLSLLLKTETKKHTAQKKRSEKECADGQKSPVQKNSFIKSLISNLRMLRKLESENRSKNSTEDVIEEYSDNEDDDEFIVRRTKRRRSFHA